MADDTGGTQGTFADIPSVPSVSPTPTLDLSYGDMRLCGLIGQGGNGTVHEVTTPDGQSVALKRPHMATEPAREQFLDEAETWSHLSHRFIISVHGSGIDPEPWIALELADEGTLLDRLGQMRVDEALWTSVAIAEAVRYAHERGVMHYDLKPENVLLCSTPDGQWSVPKVTDWGLSELLLTQEGKPKGLTYPYAAPEQFDRGTETGSQTDIYQLGATIYALLTGRQLVSGSRSEIVEDVRAGNWPVPTAVNPVLPNGVDRVLSRALTPVPGDRYESVLLFKRALEAVFRDAYVATSVTHQGVTTRRTGVVDAVGPDSAPSERWRTELDSSPVGSPVVADGLTSVVAAGGTLVTLEVASGGVSTSTTLHGRPLGGPELVNDELRVLTDAPALFRVGTDPFEGKGGFELAFTPRSSVLHGDELTFLTTADRELLALDDRGHVTWRVKLPGNPGGLVAATADHVVVPTFRGTVCLDVEGGSQRWSDATDTPHRCTPAITADAAIVCGDGSVGEVDIRTGAERWRVSTPGRVTGVSLTDTTAFVGTDTGRLLAVDRSTGVIDWNQLLKGRVVNQPCVANETVYVGCAGQDGRPLPSRMDSVFAFDVTDGTRRWGASSGSAVVGAPVVGDGVLIVGTTDGDVVAFDSGRSTL